MIGYERILMSCGMTVDGKANGVHDEPIADSPADTTYLSGYAYKER
jgi:hypothetical protein